VVHVRPYAATGVTLCAHRTPTRWPVNRSHEHPRGLPSRYSDGGAASSANGQQRNGRHPGNVFPGEWGTGPPPPRCRPGTTRVVLRDAGATHRDTGAGVTCMAHHHAADHRPHDPPGHGHDHSHHHRHGIIDPAIASTDRGRGADRLAPPHGADMPRDHEPARAGRRESRPSAVE
jgi:hypothetical protein